MLTPRRRAWCRRRPPDGDARLAVGDDRLLTLDQAPRGGVGGVQAHRRVGHVVLAEHAGDVPVGGRRQQDEGPAGHLVLPVGREPVDGRVLGDQPGPAGIGAGVGGQTSWNWTAPSGCRRSGSSNGPTISSRRRAGRGSKASPSRPEPDGQAVGHLVVGPALAHRRDDGRGVLDPVAAVAGRRCRPPRSWSSRAARCRRSGRCRSAPGRGRR